MDQLAVEAEQCQNSVDTNCLTELKTSFRVFLLKDVKYKIVIKFDGEGQFISSIKIFRASPKSQYACAEMANYKSLGLRFDCLNKYLYYYYYY